MAEVNASSGPQTKCDHTFFQRTILKPVPTYCDYCHKIIWIWQAPFHNCSKCDVYYHKECFSQIMVNKEAMFANVGADRDGQGANASLTPQTPISPGQGHVHRFQWKSYFLPTFCTVCKKLMTGFRRQGLECLDCDTHVHEGCIPAGSQVLKDGEAKKPAVAEPPKSSFAGALAPVQDAKRFINFRLPWEKEKPAAAAGTGDDVATAGVRSAQEEQDKAISNTFQMLQVFNKRNKRWASNAINPPSMLGLYKRHADLYLKACASLPDANLSVERLAECRSILVYATAAYGKAYDEGYFDGNFGAVLLRIGHKDITEPKPEANTLAVCNVLGLPRSAIHYANWSGEIYEPNFYILLDLDKKRIVLCFRGSLSDADWLTDATGELDPFCGAQCHRGILNMSSRVFSNQEAMATLNRLLDAYPAFAFIVTGHSLGAGLTSVFTAKAVYENTFKGKQTPRGFAFAPPPTMTLPLADTFDGVLTNLVAAKDCVSRLQYNSLDRLGFEIASYERRAEPTSEGDLSEECHIPGLIYMITKPTNRDTRLIPVPRNHILLHQIFLSKYMLTNHHMHNYDEGMKVVYDRTVKGEAQGALSRGASVVGDDEEHDGSAIDLPTTA
jgi:hypothetical protein